MHETINLKMLFPNLIRLYQFDDKNLMITLSVITLNCFYLVFGKMLLLTAGFEHETIILKIQIIIPNESLSI